MCYSIVMCSICGSVCTCLYVSLSIYIHQPSGTFTHTTLHQILCPNMRPSSILQVAVNQKKASMGIYIYIYIYTHSYGHHDDEDKDDKHEDKYEYDDYNGNHNETK